VSRKLLSLKCSTTTFIKATAIHVYIHQVQIQLCIVFDLKVCVLYFSKVVPEYWCCRQAFYYSSVFFMHHIVFRYDF